MNGSSMHKTKLGYKSKVTRVQYKDAWWIDSHYQIVIVGTVFGMVIREEFDFTFIIFKTSLGIKI